MTIIEQIRSLNIIPFASHITRIENLDGICDIGGIRPRNKVKAGEFTDISEASVQEIRSRKKVPQMGKMLHNYVPFFLTFKAPMVAMRQTQNEELVYVQVSLDIFTRVKGCVLTDGNATNSNTKFELFDRVDALKILDLSVLYKVNYGGDKEKARKKAAELLAPDLVPIGELKTLIFYSNTGRDKALEILKKHGINCGIKVWPRYFFEPKPKGTN